jgi:hypothetical protein
LYTHLVGKSYAAQNALADIVALQEILGVAFFTSGLLQRYTFQASYRYIQEVQRYNKKSKWST